MLAWQSGTTDAAGGRITETLKRLTRIEVYDPADVPDSVFVTDELSREGC